MNDLAALPGVEPINCALPKVRLSECWANLPGHPSTAPRQCRKAPSNDLGLCTDCKRRL